MKRSRADLARGSNEEFSTEAKRTFEPERNMREIEGHLQQLLFQKKELPGFPGSHRFGKPSWLTPLIEKVGISSCSHLRKWGLSSLVVFAKHYSNMLLHWDAISALIEIWHPQTHTFIFPSFEATILIEETELFLGLKRLKAKRKATAHCMNPLNARDFIFNITGDWMQARNLVNSNGVILSKLARWAMKAKDEDPDDEKIAQALSLCLAGLIFFPNQDDVLDQEHLGVIQSAWEGKSVAQAVLAYLYSGLSSACLGKQFYGSAILLDIWLSYHLKMDLKTSATDSNTRSYKKTPIFLVKGILRYPDMMVINTLQLRSLADWRRYLARLPCEKVVFTSDALAELKLKTRPSKGVDLRLVGSKELVLYNAHRCHLQVGQPRHKVPQLSHHPPIEQRNFGSSRDQVDVRTCLELWKIGCKNKANPDLTVEDADLVEAYVNRIRKLRSIRP